MSTILLAKSDMPMTGVTKSDLMEKCTSDNITVKRATKKEQPSIELCINSKLTGIFCALVLNRVTNSKPGVLVRKVGRAQRETTNQVILLGSG